MCRFCCKSPFALVIKISFGCTRDFRVKMWGISSPEDKLAGELGNVIEVASTGCRRSDFFTAEKFAVGHLGLLQQYRHNPDGPDRPLSLIYLATLCVLRSCASRRARSATRSMTAWVNVSALVQSTDRLNSASVRRIFCSTPVENNVENNAVKILLDFTKHFW